MPDTTQDSVATILAIMVSIIIVGSFYTGHLPFHMSDSDGGKVVSVHAQAPSQNSGDIEASMVLDSVGSIPAGLITESEPTPNSIPVIVTTPAPQPNSELVDIVAYIAKVFEPEGKEVVVQAINCFYSESGLRSNAVNQNTDEHQSKDWGVAQLNSFYHNLSEEEKTEYKANIDRAYQIYKGRGGNFSAWYGKRCN